MRSFGLLLANSLSGQVSILGRASQPLVSIVIPAYQAAGRIRETLDSAFAQTYPNFEIILVNDGSPDTAELEQAIQGYDSRLIYIKQENRGPSGARNAAIRRAQGKYVACLDSDDIYLPDHLSALVDLMEANRLDLAYSDSNIVRNGVRSRRAFEEEPQHPPVTFEKLLKEECCVMTSATVASRQAMIDAGLFDERFRRCEDFDLWLRMAFRGARMDFHRAVGIEHRLLSDGLSSDNYLLKKGRIEVFRKLLETLPLSTSQEVLVRSLITRTEGNGQMDLAKRYAKEGRYAEASQAADKARDLLKTRKSRWTAWAVRNAPRAVGRFLRLRETRTARKRTIGAASDGNLKMTGGSVQLEPGKQP